MGVKNRKQNVFYIKEWSFMLQKNIYLPSADKYSAVIKTEICYIKVTIVMFFEQKT